MSEIPVIPFCEIRDGVYIPNPQSIIQIALSNYRNSDLSDKELASHICGSLGTLMLGSNLKIETYNNIRLTFKESKE